MHRPRKRGHPLVSFPAVSPPVCERTIERCPINEKINFVGSKVPCAQRKKGGALLPRTVYSETDTSTGSLSQRPCLVQYE